MSFKNIIMSFFDKIILYERRLMDSKTFRLSTTPMTNNRITQNDKKYLLTLFTKSKFLKLHPKINGNLFANK